MNPSPDSNPDTPPVGGSGSPGDQERVVDPRVDIKIHSGDSAPVDVWKIFLKIFGSFHLCFAILLFMGLITLLGTLAQAHMSLFKAQSLYFDSWYVLHPLNVEILNRHPVVPLPGGMLLMALLMVNLVVGGLLRIRVSKRNIGVVVTHVGVILLLLAGFVRYMMATEGALLVWEGGHSSQFQSYHNWEISISTPTGQDKIQRWVIPWKDLADLRPRDSRTFRRDELPFEINVYAFLPNARARKVRRSATYPVVNGFALASRPLEKKDELNMAGCYLNLIHPKGKGASQEVILFSGGSRDGADEVYPYTAFFEGKPYEFRLRRETHRLPFDVELADFRAIYYPRTMMPKAYESDVVVREMVDGEPRGKGVAVNISMNRPLRKEGYAVYQSSFGPQQRDYNGPMYSVFSVAKNPSDQVPFIACLVIALGMLIHFTQKFGKWVQKEQKGRAA